MDLAPPPTQCSFLTRALGLLETEPGLRGAPERTSLLQSIIDLEAEAVASGAEEQTLKLIRSARSIVEYDPLKPSTPVRVTA